MAEPVTLSPYKDLSLMVGAHEEYVVEGSLWCKVEMEKYGVMTLTSAYSGMDFTVTVAITVTVKEVRYQFVQVFRICVFQGMLLD